MKILKKIPGLAHLLRGELLRGFLVGGLLLFFIVLMLVRHELMLEALQSTWKKLRGEAIPYGGHEIDLLVSTLFLPLATIATWIFGARSLRPRDPEALAADGPWSIVWKQFKKNRLAVSGSIIILILYLVAILCPFLAPYDPTRQFHRVNDVLLEPSLKHLLGTDGFARDVLSRLIHGSRISLLVGFLAVGIAVTIGTLYGSIAGYFGGWIDSVLMRIVDMLLAFPTLVLIITVIALWRKQSIWIIITVIGLMSWMGVARLVRGQFLALKEREFFAAARALGARPARLIFRHLLPNAMTPIIVSATLRVGTTILTEAALSYLGLGVQPPTPSWGNIVYETRDNFSEEWWIPFAAGTAVVITVVGYNLLGDGLRDALDPRLRH